MTRSFLFGVCLTLLLVSTGWCEPQAPAKVADKPVITAVMPRIEELYNDLKLVFDLVGDEKGYKTLKETIEVFLEGVENDKPAGVRIFTTADGLRPVISLPVKDESNFKKFLENLWDLDVKTMPPPSNVLLPQVPRAVRNLAGKLKLQPNERIIFGLYDGFVKNEPGHIQLAELVEDVRLAKGGVPVDIAKGMDLAVHIDGESKTPKERRDAFVTPKKEVLAALEKGEKETDAEFALRKSLTEHQVAEFERFFAESSRIQIGAIASSEKKHARIEIELAAMQGTSLAESIAMIDQSPDDFAGVSKQGCVLTGEINFPLDPLRQQALTSISKQSRDVLKAQVDADEERSANQKAIDKDLVDLVFDVVDDIGGTGMFNGFIRGWSNGNGTLTAVGATKVPNGAKFVPVLEKFSDRGDGTVQLKLDSQDDVEIHKLTVPELQKDYPELFSPDGSVYVGTSDKALWYAMGDKAIERLKQAIQEAKAAGSKPGPTTELHATLYPLVEAWDKIRSRQKKPAATSPRNKADRDRESRRERTVGILADLDLRKLALDAFKGGQDTLSLSLVRKGDAVDLALQVDEGVLRFIGKSLSKFVKDNLGDE